ncbi:MAG: tetratricopeptide repeat protein [Candidatus Methylacidiphilales bacterium]|nr:tetratricopeptide repeat protein [Candidatus Methylacidiphilales bacterium]
MLGWFAAVTPLAAESSFFERRAMSLAQQTFQDNLYDAAEDRLTKFLAKYPDSDFKTEARWLLGQAYFFQGKLPQALEIFKTPPTKGDDKFRTGYLYWEAQTLAAQERWAEAAERHQTFLKNHPEDPLADDVRIGLAAALHRLEKNSEAMALLDPIIAAGFAQPPARKAALQKSRILITSGNFTTAHTLLESLASEKPDPATTYEAAYWTGELAQAEKEPDRALEWYRKITGDSRARPRNLVPLAWFGTGLAHAAKENWTAASDAFEQAFSLALDPKVVEPAVVRYLEANAKSNTLAKAGLRVRQFVRKKEGTSTVGLFAIGRFYRDQGNDDAAIAELDFLINSYPSSEWRWPARILMGECLKRKGDLEGASAAMEEVITQNKTGPYACRAFIRQGEWLAEKKDDAGAAQKFLAAVGAADSPDEKEANLFRALLAWSRAGNLDQFNLTYQALEQLNPQSRHRPVALMEKARLLNQNGKTEESAKIYQELSARGDDPERAAQAAHQLALGALEKGDSASAIRSLRQIEKDFPTYSGLADASYRRILTEVNLDLLKGEAVRTEWQQFIERFPGHPAVINAEFQVARWLYQQGNLAEAQTRFLEFTQSHTDHSLAPVAAYYAGKAAATRGEFKEAIPLLEKVAEKSPVKIDARLLQIRCLMNLSQYEAALTVADSILANRKEDAAWVEASLRKAGSLFTLATQDPKKLDQALAVTEAILASPAANTSQRNEAGFLRGQTLARLDRKNLALQAYLDVVYGRLLPPEVTQQSPEPEFHWFIKSGLAAAQMREDQGDIRGAVEIYRILERLGDPNREEFRKKIEDLKSRNFLFEDA